MVFSAVTYNFKCTSSGALKSTDHSGSKFGSAIREKVLALVGDIDELLFELHAQTFQVEGKTVAVTPKITEIKSYGPADEYYLNFAGVMDIKVS